MNWTVIQNAIHAWVVATSGLAASRVLWARQNLPRPDGCWISLRTIALAAVGQDAITVSDAPSPAPGAEIRTTHGGHRVVTLSIQCFNGEGQGSESPEAILEEVRTGARLASVHDALTAAGVGLLSFEAIRSIDGHTNPAVFEPRAVLTCSLCVPSEIFELGTFIETVDIARVSP